MAVANVSGQQAPRYFRTRLDLMDALLDLVRGTVGPVLIAWDFPFGYPIGSELGGGRTVAAKLAGLIDDHVDGGNNRFDVAADLNRAFGDAPGPFWGCPRSQAGDDLSEKKQDFSPFPFNEWRVVERAARQAGHHHLQSVWKLFTTGSVGGQALIGLALIERLNHALADDPRPRRWWPFDTGWDRQIDGIVHAECWPSLFPFSHIDHPIRDAQQVAATAERLWTANCDAGIGALLSCPDWLTGPQRHAAETEEGWILGF